MTRQKYHIYRNRRSLIAHGARKVLGEDSQLRGAVRKLDDNNLAQHMMVIRPESAYGLDGLIIAEELQWERDGKHVLFTQSPEFLTRLLNAKFDLSVTGGFQLPFYSFMLPMPLGFKPVGVALVGILVTSYRLDQTREVLRSYARYLQQPVNPNLARALGIDAHNYKARCQVPDAAQNPTSDDLADDEPLLCIALLDNLSNPLMASTIRASEGFSRIPDLLAAATPDEFWQRLGPMKHSNYRVRDVSTHDAAAEFYAFKLVCALSVYNMATRGDLLKPGFPGNTVPHVEGRLDRKTSQSFTLGQGSLLSKKDAPSAHYRQWHFRQLRDKRFYHGEHRQKPIGSRWVFVRDTVVAENDVDPYTLSDREAQ
jgi:hypothetical protein